MSRAFTKERDDAPDQPVRVPPRTHRPEITPGGLERLRARRAATTDPTERTRLDEMLEGLVAVGPPDDRTRVAFGATVDVDDGARVQTYTIVGEDEADVRAGRIPVTSPLADALLTARVGKRVTWHRPVGDLRLTVRAIRYD